MRRKLIDEHRYDEWLALWTEDGLYWVPCNSDDADPARQAMIIYDNRARLEERIYRLTSGAAWAQQPRSRTRRLISNVEVRRNRRRLRGRVELHHRGIAAVAAGYLRRPHVTYAAAGG